jgi:transcription-repair coupling factor (superfamily II helicase)
VSVSINLGIDVSIPQDYISEIAQRLRTYKRISSAESEEILRQIYSEIGDRYGKMPASVENLFEYARLRRFAEQMRVVSIDKTKDGFAVKLNENARVAPENLMEFLTNNENANFSPSGVLKIVSNEKNLIEAVRQVLERIKAKG